MSLEKHPLCPWCHSPMTFGLALCLCAIVIRTQVAGFDLELGWSLPIRVPEWEENSSSASSRTCRRRIYIQWILYCSAVKSYSILHCNILKSRYILWWMAFYNQGWPSGGQGVLSLPEHTQTEWVILVEWSGSCHLHVSFNKSPKDCLEKKHDVNCLKTFPCNLQVSSRTCQHQNMHTSIQEGSAAKKCCITSAW